MKHSLTIPINVLSNRGVVQESPSDFSESFFADVYGQALNTIAMIIKNNENAETLSQQIKKPYFTQSTIAFSGRRGTGKTSVMNAVCNYLLTNEPERKGFCDPEIKKVIDDVEFFSIPQMIDASHLDENEDLLEVIIAYIIKEIKEIKDLKDFDEEKHGEKADSLSLSLAKMQNDYDSLIQTNNKTINTSYEMLIKGADKHLIQYEFKKIIDDYLELRSNILDNKKTYNKKSKYLIICIDDIDMYPGDPVQILQCIYRYFMLPNIIVLTSLNFELLYQYTYKHFYKKLVSKKEGEIKLIFALSMNSKREEICQAQSNDYLRKILPIDMRIVMPSWKKSDYKDLIKKEVRLFDQDQIYEFNNSFPNLIPGRFYTNICRKIKKGEQTMSVKKFIFQLLADRTGIYLDASGYKAHFMEPDSLRSMNDLFYTLYSMNNIRQQGVYEKKYTDENKDRIRQNYKTILDTFYFKILPNLALEDEEPGLFGLISSEPITRRNKIIIDHYNSYLKNRARHLKQNGSMINSDEDEKINRLLDYPSSDYSIGELFKVLHNSSRDNSFSKDMVKAILASYSFKLPYLYDEGIYLFEEKVKNNKQTSKTPDGYNNPFSNEYFKPLFEVFGDSLLGSWNKDLFMKKRLRCYLDPTSCDVRTEDGIKHIIRCLLFVRLDEMKKDEYIQFSRFKKASTTNAVLSLDEKKQNNRLFIKYDLDPTAFLINIIRFDEFESVVKKSLGFIDKDETTNLVKNVFEDYHNKIDDIVTRENEKQSNPNKQRTYYPLFPFPFHQTDIAYNVIKRAIKDLIYFSDSSIEIRMDRSLNDSNEILDTIQIFYQNIYNELLKVKQNYPLFNNPDDDETNDNNVFAEMFLRAGEKLELWKVISEDDHNKIQLERNNDKFIMLMDDKDNNGFFESKEENAQVWEKTMDCSLNKFVDYLESDQPDLTGETAKELEENEEQSANSI